jgi:hypothetical protein
MARKKKHRLGINENDPFIKAVRKCQRTFSGRALYACEAGVDWLYDAQEGRILSGRRRR